jgi:hypothetical protein
MRVPPSRPWKISASLLALGVGVGSGYVVSDRAELGSVSPAHFDSPSPPVSAPPRHVRNDSEFGLLEVFAEVDGRPYRIVVGRMDPTDADDVWWSAALSQGEDYEVGWHRGDEGVGRNTPDMFDSR